MSVAPGSTDVGRAGEISPAQMNELARAISEAESVPLAGRLQSSLLSGGRSNLTYRLTDGVHSWVLRRPPLGDVLETAHDMAREYRVMTALRDSDVPVPRTTLFHSDPGLLGAPFYVMDLVEGRVLRTAEDMAALAPQDAQRVSCAFIDTVADLHLVDYAAVGLADFGRPDGYLHRQVARWIKQLDATRSREIEGFGALGQQLAATVPASARASIVHGDFRLDNAIIDSTDHGRVLAILDWEMATLGDPLSDLGLFYLYWQGWGGLDNPIAATPAEQPGYPCWDDLAARYTARTSTELENFNWYKAFAIFKFAVICEGIHFRHVSGNTIGEGFDRIGAMVPELVHRGMNELTR